MHKAKPLPAMVHSLTEASLLLAASVAQAEEIQWTAAPVPRPREDTTQRATGGHSDPTAATVLDERRLAVREAVEEAARELAGVTEAMHVARRKIDRAIARWYGD